MRERKINMLEAEKSRKILFVCWQSHCAMQTAVGRLWNSPVGPEEGPGGTVPGGRPRLGTSVV